MFVFQSGDCRAIIIPQGHMQVQSKISFSCQSLHLFLEHLSLLNVISVKETLCEIELFFMNSFCRHILQECEDLLTRRSPISQSSLLGASLEQTEAPGPSTTGFTNLNVQVLDCFFRYDLRCPLRNFRSRRSRIARSVQ